ncbi:uncharacterized protein DUF1702 [Micromonospora pisi]|uniref:Uncharacterized protein DUF1702 n=1 Tax=Micromonospora pisi TaxID=589240 RepID=A0A495JEU0_9ACTN|nr:DUF1702 family protein [Micromonospora pisi]RKR86904.1 uncharacterized protein DUF1702 [Micromonospora pisi]
MSIYRTLRRRILTPNVSETRMDTRGFHVKSEEGRDLLETIGASFLTGYGYAAEARTSREAEQRLEGVPLRFRGFAYEGAAMGFAVREGLPVGGRGLVADFLAGRGDAHVYMVYVGVGWAMARLPRFRWSTLTAPDPLLRWLVLDGYGFHQAYFQTDRYIHQQYQEKDFPWPSDHFRWYANRAIDQGIGRAMWFVGGTDAELVATMINNFPESRRADLYSGAGLAATYAGGCDEPELRRLWDLGWDYRPQIAQGSAFAAGARARAGLIVPHNEIATQLFCGTSVEQAWKVTDEALVDLPDDHVTPSWEVWRQRIADSFTAHTHH